MKHTIYTTILLVIFLLSSCTKSINVEKSFFIGEWRSTKAEVENKDIKELTNGYFVPQILGFKDDGSYYYDYNSGLWDLDDQNISLSNFGTFKLIEIMEDNIILDIEITEGELYYDFEGIENNEIITFRQYFTRRQ